MADENSFDRDEALFLSIMYSFHAAAMQQMGKIANPFTGKVERDLDAARGTIDVLAMFQKKTEGNLSERERRVLTGLITELQLNFVDESKRGPAAEGEAAKPEGAAAAEPTPGAEAAAEGEKAEEAPPAEGEEEPPAKVERRPEPAEAEEAAEEKPEKKTAKKRRSAKKKKKES